MKNVSLPKAQYIKVRAQSVDFLEIKYVDTGVPVSDFQNLLFEYELRFEESEAIGGRIAARRIYMGDCQKTTEFSEMV